MKGGPHRPERALSWMRLKNSMLKKKLPNSIAPKSTLAHHRDWLNFNTLSAQSAVPLLAVPLFFFGGKSYAICVCERVYTCMCACECFIKACFSLKTKHSFEGNANCLKSATAS